MFLYKIYNYYIMPIHKSEDYKLSAVEYYLTEDKTQEEVCKYSNVLPSYILVST